MGYDVHVTRAESWTDAEATPIRLEEWLAYVRSDQEMRLDGRAEAETAAGKLVYRSPGLAVWRAYSKDGEDGNHAWFDLSHGCIVVKNPDAEILLKLSLIGLHFHARIQGDDGEDYYGLDGMPVED